MKQFFSFILVAFVLFAFIKKSSTLNAGDAAVSSNLASVFGIIPSDITGSDETTGNSKADPNAIDTSLQISNYVRCVFQQDFENKTSGNLWLATYGKGAGRFNGRKLDFFERSGGLSGDYVRDIQTDSKGNMWFATDGGASYYDGKTFTNFTKKEGLVSDNVWTILEDRDGFVWFGTDGGVSRYNPATPGANSFVTVSIPEADLTNFSQAYPAAKLVNKIFQDKSGLIWFGTNGNGVYVFDPSNTEPDYFEQLKQISEKDGLCNNFIQGIYQDTKGQIWFSSRFGGVSCFNPDYATADGKNKTSGNKLFTNYTMKNGLSSNFVWSVLEDKNGNMWFATAGGGVDFMNNVVAINSNSGCNTASRFTNYTTTNGLASNYVQSMTEDKSGNIWFATGNGISRYVPDSKPKASWIMFTSYPSKRNGC